MPPPFSRANNDPSKKPAKAGSKLSFLILLFDPEDGGYICLRITRCYDAEHRPLHSHCRDNLRSSGMMTVKDGWEGLGKEAAFTDIFRYILAVLQWSSERPLR
jgi:hypothetical protein